MLTTTNNQLLLTGHGGWRVLRLRKDKDTPNVDWVANKVWESIVQQITLRELVAAAVQKT